MYVAELDGDIVGILNFVVKHQGTLKISPLIVRQTERGQGISRMLFEKVFEYARKHDVRQIYCTVSERNMVALGYFLAHGFVRAGKALRQYRTDMDEIMLYKIVEHLDLPLNETIISILPLTEEDKPQVRKLVLDRLVPNFEGVNDSWVDALFAGYDRRDSGDPNEKYKLMWVAKASDGTILGVAAATPKKGEPIKLMPLTASTIEAFWALVAELPGLLSSYGHKLYTHAVPSSVEVETFQHHGWQIEAMMPESYKSGVVAQQWGLILEGDTMKTMRVKRQYFDAIMAGTKPLEVRIGYNSIRKIAAGDQIRLECARLAGIVQVVAVRVYDTFAEMFDKEEAGHIVPENPQGALKVLQGIYPPDKEALGVYVLQLKVIRKSA
jgi:ASC-1-like (ASCH) protein/predicted GNAT family acetyltransferase